MSGLTGQEDFRWHDNRKFPDSVSTCYTCKCDDWKVVVTSRPCNLIVDITTLHDQLGSSYICLLKSYKKNLRLCVCSCVRVCACIRAHVHVHMHGMFFIIFVPPATGITLVDNSNDAAASSNNTVNIKSKLSARSWWLCAVCDSVTSKTSPGEPARTGSQLTPSTAVPNHVVIIDNEHDMRTSCWAKQTCDPPLQTITRYHRDLWMLAALGIRNNEYTI